MSDINNSMKKLNITGTSSGYDSPGGVERTSGSSGSGGPPQRKADLAYNHLQLVDRPGLCKAARMKINVVSNYFLLNAPTHVKFVTFRLDFELEPTRSNAPSEVPKKEKLAGLFLLAYREHRNIFPHRDAALVYNGTDMIYCPPDHRITQPHVDFVAVPAGPPRNGRPGRARRGRMTITPLGLSDLPTVRIDNEQDKCAVMQFLDCVLTQEHRFDLTGTAARFVQHGHSLFKIPRTSEEKRRDVKQIGKGEEVWLGLHAAVKCDADELMLNADTSGSIFKAQNLNLVDFFAQVVRGYTSSLANVNFDNLTIDRRSVGDLERALKGTKVLMKMPNGQEKVKKFDRISQNAADQEYFTCDGREISVADFFRDKYSYRLRCPKFPCLQFYNKISRQSSSIPIELFYTLEEPTRFKGKLTDQQLDVFVKAVCQDPRDKKTRIERFCAGGGEYLGETAVMREWGVSLEKTMVTIEDCPVLPLPHIEMNASAPHVAVDLESGQFKITETVDGTEKPIKPVELTKNKFVMAIVNVNEPMKQGDMAHAHLLAATLRTFGYQVNQGIGQFSICILPDRPRGAVNNVAISNTIQSVKTKCDEIKNGSNLGDDIVPLIIWVFPRRNAVSYGAIKYYCDVVHGVASQCCTRKTFEKLTGNPTTNTSAQNLLLKIQAKTGSISYRLSSHGHKNVERLQNPEDPVLILGIDVSHPGREERFDAIQKHEKQTGRNAEQANKYRGQHEKLPTARPAGEGLFKSMSYYDCPRSVVSVVGTTDIKGSRYGVSSRVQRLGQEDTVNMVEPFRERIQEFFDSTGSLPKHIIMYRDGASDTQLKKIAYEELESLERAMETFEMEKEQCTVTYITAVKRHHTRLFRANLDQMPREAPHPNCPPGTLIETRIVSRNKWDFYLQSHYGNLGTALPTRYTVVRDDWKVSPAFIQTIVFAHCFGNARCPRPLSIPIPLHYAHLAAKRSKVLFDHYKEYPSHEYTDSREDIVREEIERQAVTPHPNIKHNKAMHYA